MGSKKNYTNELIYKTETDTYVENKLMATGGNGLWLLEEMAYGYWREWSGDKLGHWD